MHPYLQQLEAAHRIRDMRLAGDAARLARQARRGPRRARGGHQGRQQPSGHGRADLELEIPRPRESAEQVTGRAA